MSARVVGPRWGESGGGRGRLRGEPGDWLRLWRRYREGGWAAFADRPPMPMRQPRRLSREAEAEILAARSYATRPRDRGRVVGRPASTVWKVLRRYGHSRLPRPAASRCSATSGSGRASSCTSTSSGSAASGQSARRSTATGSTATKAPAGSTCTSRSTTTPGSPTPSCSRQRARPTASPSCAAQSAGTPTGRHDRTRPHRQRQRLPLHRWRDACAELGIERRYTRPRRPQTNGKAEALVKTLLREWAYRFAYPTSAHRARALPGYLRWYNHHDHTAHSEANPQSTASHTSVGPTSRPLPCCSLGG